MKNVFNPSMHISYNFLRILNLLILRLTLG